MDVAFCLEALEAALADHARPEIFNTDQGSQFTSAAFTGVLERAGVAISMDGRGRWMGNRRREIAPPARFLILLHHRAPVAIPEV
jgi:transposase InsO family protein